MALKRLRLIQRRKALGFTQESLAETGRLRTDHGHPLGTGRDRASAVGPPSPHPGTSAHPGGAERAAGRRLGRARERDGFTLVTSVPLDFSLSADYTVRIMEGFSAHDIASRREALAGLAVITGAALLHPVRQWAASLALLPGSPPDAGTDEVAELEQAVTVFRRWDASGAGGLRRKAVVGQLNAVAESLNDHHPPAITRRLFQVTAELAQLSGWMAYDQGLYGLAQRYYLLAAARLPRRLLPRPRGQGHRRHDPAIDRARPLRRQPRHGPHRAVQPAAPGQRPGPLRAAGPGIARLRPARRQRDRQRRPLRPDLRRGLRGSTPARKPPRTGFTT